MIFFLLLVPMVNVVVLVQTLSLISFLNYDFLAFCQLQERPPFPQQRLPLYLPLYLPTISLLLYLLLLDLLRWIHCLFVRQDLLHLNHHQSVILVLLLILSHLLLTLNLLYPQPLALIPVYYQCKL